MNQYVDLEKIKRLVVKQSFVSEKQRNGFLRALSKELTREKRQIIEANERDVARAGEKLAASMIERLRLDESGVEKLTLKLNGMEGLKAGLGETIEEKVGEQGLDFKKVRVPLGVILVIYEARPEVTIDVAALCVKSGNAAILKGGSEAMETNKVLFGCVLTALGKAGIERETINFIASGDRRIIKRLLKEHDYIDLVVARGGYGLVKAVLDQSKIPVLAHAAGGARIYIDESADLAMAEKIILNAKLSKPAACNSLDTIVIHRNVTSGWLSNLVGKLREKGVETVEGDWGTEFLGLQVSMKIVKTLKRRLSL